MWPGSFAGVLNIFEYGDTHVRSTSASVAQSDMRVCETEYVDTEIAAAGDIHNHVHALIGTNSRSHTTSTHHDLLYVLLALRHATLSSPRTHSCIRELTRDSGVPSARDQVPRRAFLELGASLRVDGCDRNFHDDWAIEA